MFGENFSLLGTVWILNIYEICAGKYGFPRAYTDHTQFDNLLSGSHYDKVFTANAAFSLA